MTITAALPVAGVAVIAGIVSYSHIAALGLRTGQSTADAHLLPLAVDGLIVAGSVILLAGSALGWLGVVLGVAATLFANIESGLPHGHLAAAVASWPAIAFSVASFMLERWLKSQVVRPNARDTRISQGGQEAAVNVSDIHVDPVGDDTRSGLGNEPEPVVATCGHEVASTPEERVVQDYLHGRDCLGEKPSQRRLAAAHNVSRPKVAALVGPLNGHHACPVATRN